MEYAMKITKAEKPAAPKGFVLEEKIGEGASSRVWLSHHEKLDKKVAIKVVSKQYLRDPRQKSKFLQEMQLHRLMNHPFIAQLFGVKDNCLNYYLIIEFVPNGSLLEKVTCVGHLSEKDGLRYFTQILSAVNYLHETLHIVHRDLKLENIMVDAKSNVKLIDFGFSHSYSPDEEQLSTPCGSPRYTAPEMFTGKPYTKAVDVWSLGIILYVMLIGKFPFEGESIQKLSKHIQNKEPVYPIEISKELRSLLRALLEKDPKKRITLKQISNCSVIKEYLKKHPLTSSNSSNSLSEADRSALVADLNDEVPLSLAATPSKISSSSPRLLETDPKSETMNKLCQSGRFKPKDRTTSNGPSPMSSKKAGHRRQVSIDSRKDILKLIDSLT